MNIIAELEAVLKEEEETLLNGNLGALESLLERKTRLVAWLAARKPELPPETLRRLMDKASHNDALLSSARLGLQAAMKQLRETARTSEQSIYSRTGERQPMSPAPSSVTQRI